MSLTPTVRMLVDSGKDSLRLEGILSLLGSIIFWVKSAVPNPRETEYQ